MYAAVVSNIYYIINMEGKVEVNALDFSNSDPWIHVIEQWCVKLVQSTTAVRHSLWQCDILVVSPADLSDHPKLYLKRIETSLSAETRRCP